MQTEILLKQLHSSLGELKTAIEKFEKHPSPSTDYAERLHDSIYKANKLVSAYLVLKEHKDVSPDLNLHLKLMNIPSPEERTTLVEPVKDEVPVEPHDVKKEEIKPVEVIEPAVEKPIAPVAEVKQPAKTLPNIVININDKFRFINELFASNANEYNIAIEQINAVSSPAEMSSYLKGLKSIYSWNDDNEVVKTLYALAQKRFS
jgi:hypothetical protein